MSSPISIWRNDTAPGTARAGSYSLTVEQIVNIDRQYADPTLKQTIHLEVRSDRFSPVEVRFRYPQDKAVGKFGDIIPHVVLSHGSVPWERTAYREGNSPDVHKGLPWLALLAVTETHRESVKLVNGTVSDVFSTSASPYLGIPGREDAWENSSQPCRYLEMAHSVFLELAPAAPQLANLCYFQQERAGEKGPLLGNAVVLHHKPLRKSLKAATGGVKLFLVSLEGMAPFLPSIPAAPGEDRKKNIRLTVLGSWETVVTAEPGHADFEAMAAKLKESHGPLWYDEKKAAFAGYLKVPTGSSCKEPCVYLGPLGLPVSNPSVEHPIESAQKALRRVVFSGVAAPAIDIGLSAAWKLGKMIALNDHGLAQGLYEFRHDAILDGERRIHDKDHKGLGLPAPDLLVQRIFDLRLLKGVPLHYILPQPETLPPESLRYAQLDDDWCGALIAGALSVGRHCRKHFETDRELYNTLHNAIPKILHDRAGKPLQPAGHIFCFLLRSEIVHLWPGLEIDAWDFTTDPPASGDNPAKVQRTVLRREKVAPDVLLVMVYERCSYLRFSLPGALLHFAVDSKYTDTALDSLFIDSDACKGSTAHAARLRHQRQEAVFSYRF